MTIQTVCSIAAVLIAGLAFFRNASDKRIDERIDLKLSADIAVIKQQLATIQTTLVSVSGHDAALVKSAIEASVTAIHDTASVLNDTAVRLTIGRRQRAET